MNHLQVESSPLSPHEIIVLAISQGTVMEAVIDGKCTNTLALFPTSLLITYRIGYKKKTPVEIYQNACARLGLPVLSTVENVLRDYHGGVLKLSGAGLSSRDATVMTQVLKRIPPLNTLDLSANLFCT